MYRENFFSAVTGSHLNIGKVVYIMMIRAEYRNADIMTAVRGSVNTLRTVTNDMRNCNGDYEAMATSKEKSKHSDCVRKSYVFQHLMNGLLGEIEMG